MAYATRSDIAEYMPHVVEDIWGNDESAVDSALENAFRSINETLRGLDRFKDSDIPIANEDDGKSPETLVKLNVYEAVWQGVTGVYAGEVTFEDNWGWVRREINVMWQGVRDGRYAFGADPSAASTTSYLIRGRRV